MQNHAVDPFGIVGQVLDGQFRVDRLVGEGGFSAVYRGFHLGLQEPIAVKCLKLPPSLSPPVVDQFAKRFRDESRILYRLSQGNLNVVRSMAAGTWQTSAGLVVPYMVLEWLEGRSLANELTIRRTVGQQGRSLEEVVQLFAPAADGLGYAHSQGVVHRDVNPGNLFLASTAQGTRMKVLDFGVAKILDESTMNIARMHTVGQIRIFAPAYGAPEQFDDSIGQVSAATDVYAFALILLEALRDRTVNEGAHLGEFAQKAIDPNQRPTPRTLGLEVPDEVEQIFARATKLDPRERWQNARELWQALSLATNAASQHRHAQAAMETPSLGMPPGARSTRTGVAPPPEAAQAAAAQALPSARAGRMDKTMPLGAVFPKLDFPGAPGVPSGIPAATERPSDPLPSFPLDEGSQPTLGEGAPAARHGLAGTLMMTPGQGPSPAAAALAAVHEAQQRAKSSLVTTMPFAGPQGPIGPSPQPSAAGPASGTVPPQPAPAWEAPSPGYPPPGYGAPGAYAQPAVPASNPNPAVRASGYGSERGEQASMLPGTPAGVPSSGKSPVLFIAIGLGVLAVIGVVLAGASILGSKSTPPTPSASVSATAAPPSATPSAAPEPPPTAVATATATAEPDEPKVEDAGAAPSTSAKPSTPDVAPTTTPPTTPTAAPTAPPTSAPVKDAGPAVDPNAFSESAARSQLSQANGILAFCKKQGGVTGPGTAAVTFSTDGTVASVVMDPPYAGTPAGDCVSGHFRRTKVKAFSGAPKTLKHSFDVPK